MVELKPGVTGKTVQIQETVLKHTLFQDLEVKSVGEMVTETQVSEDFQMLHLS